MKLDDAELAQAMLDYQKKWQELKELEGFISQAVLERGESQKVAKVIATYYSPKHVVDYEAAAREVLSDGDSSIVAEHTTIKKYVSWRGVCEAAGIPIESRFITEEPARVVVKVKD